MEIKAITIGGSAGSFKVIVDILNRMPSGFNIPVFLCLHRLKHVRTGFVEALSLKSNLKIVEPSDKDFIKTDCVYLAPANYHMYVTRDKRISLSTEETRNHSRPALDHLFFSASDAYKKDLLAILLSGANRDGALGMHYIHSNGGTTIIQNPNEAQVNTMPLAGIELFKPDFIYNSGQIVDYLLALSVK